jgi:hypothetical protein
MPADVFVVADDSPRELRPLSVWRDEEAAFAEFDRQVADRGGAGAGDLAVLAWRLDAPGGCSLYATRRATRRGAWTQIRPMPWEPQHAS